jgi:hypothetical protein
MLRLIHVVENEEWKLEIYFHAESDMYHFHRWHKSEAVHGMLNMFVTSFSTLAAIAAGGVRFASRSMSEAREVHRTMSEACGAVFESFSYVCSFDEAERHVKRLVERIAKFRMEEPTHASMTAQAEAMEAAAAVRRVERQSFRDGEPIPFRVVEEARLRLRDHFIRYRGMPARLADELATQLAPSFVQFLSETSDDVSDRLRDFAASFAGVERPGSEYAAGGPSGVQASPQENGAARSSDRGPVVDPPAPRPARPRRGAARKAPKRATRR